MMLSAVADYFQHNILFNDDKQNCLINNTASFSEAISVKSNKKFKFDLKIVLLNHLFLNKRKIA